MNAPVLIVIGASAGGVEALIQLSSQLPKDLPAVIVIVLHQSDSVPSFLPHVLERNCQLPVSYAQDGETLQAGHVYIAPPDQHLTVSDNTLRLSHGPRQNGHRPAIDMLFDSAAHDRGSCVIGVILSGMLDDGARGLGIVKKQGGMAVVQSPKDAIFDSMPNQALVRTPADHVLPAADIGAQLARWVAEVQCRPQDDSLKQEISEHRFVQGDKRLFEAGRQKGRRTVLTCPDCGGVLWELNVDGNLHYRCHVGHAYSIESLQSDKEDRLEWAMWAAVRALEENASLARRMAVRARESSHILSVEQFDARAKQHAADAQMIRAVLEQRHAESPATLNAPEDVEDVEE